MDNQPSFDHSILIPIGVGAFALIGLCVILVAGRVTTLRGNVQEVQTATPFKYALVGTEPAITTVTSVPTEFATSAPTEAPTEAPVILVTQTRSSAFTAIPVSPVGTTSPSANTITPTRTPTSASTAPLGPSTYDDVESRLIYSGNWQAVPGSNYETSLHVSSTVGESVTFHFVGQELIVFYQPGSGFGTVRATIDGTSYPPNDENNTSTNQWILPSVPYGVHTVTITHISGGSVNLNYIVIPEVPLTPTKTATPTATPR